VNNDMTFVLVTARPWAGVSAAAPDACPPLGGLAALRVAEHRAMPDFPATTSAFPQRLHQESVSVKPGFGQQGTSVPTYINATGAAANGGSQTGSLPAWDPV
jgi:hypothetical protein